MERNLVGACLYLQEQLAEPIAMVGCGDLLSAAARIEGLADE